MYTPDDLLRCENTMQSQCYDYSSQQCSCGFSKGALTLIGHAFNVD